MIKPVRFNIQHMNAHTIGTYPERVTTVVQGVNGIIIQPRPGIYLFNLLVADPVQTAAFCSCIQNPGRHFTKCADGVVGNTGYILVCMMYKFFLVRKYFVYTLSIRSHPQYLL